ncbi:ATP-binding protein [Amphritea balenae]|uniref:histidine kinase n=1 Tax=Amphritea balenae TaxID=452629 RepID=A0A3P1SQZ8_9GAMM|nr:ATP-binding protein [Amphritea balenae]RRC98592.1 sensor histidine kinase [Amphritea balenae]GGK65807.1 two-component sensor histidine kinase [Amphritea balenae]
MNSISNTRHQLLQLSYIRTITIFGQCALLLYLFFILQVDLNFWFSAFALLAMALLNLMTLYRLKSSLPLTQLEFFFQLSADIVFYGCLLYQVGGVSNPFSALLLMPLIISATALPKSFTWLTGLLVATCYTLLLRHYVPITLPDTGHQHQAQALLNLHMFGMWINFILTAALIAWFIVDIRDSLQEKEQSLNKAREGNLHNQQLLSLATMAAGTAHEMGTPLATMRVLLHEMRLDNPNDSPLQEDLITLQNQVQNCSDRLQHLAESVREEQNESHLIPADQFLNELLDRWVLLRPTAQFDDPEFNNKSYPTIFSSIPLQQAFINLLNNAADASPEPLRIWTELQEDNMLFKIHDQGPGIPLDQAEEIGKPFVTTKGKGLGIGLFLSASALNSYGGQVNLFNHPDGGTLTEISLPIDSQENHDG